jgi:hypothetical protein
MTVIEWSTTSASVYADDINLMGDNTYHNEKQKL